MTNKKYPKSESVTHDEGPAFVIWDEKDKQAAIASYNEALPYFGAYQSAQAFRQRDFSNLQTNVSGRPGLTRQDYDFFRPDEATPVRIDNIIKRADEIYKRVGLVRNVIDLMGDFACQGIRLSHPNKRIEKFYRNWFNRISGKERSERFLNTLYRLGNVVSRVQTAKITEKDKRDIFKSVAADIKQIDRVAIEKGSIPWQINFLHPATVEVMGGPLSSLSSTSLYALHLPHNVRRAIQTPKDSAEAEIVSNLPKEWKTAAETNKPVLLPPDSTFVFHYKKDDWQTWALPMIYAIMDDVMIIEKLKLADVAALDGAISNIRIFKLGSLEHRIMPTRAAASKLASVLESNVGGGTMDLVWGPDIDLLESNSNVHQFLGEEKYRVHFQNVYSGLGIPPTLTGTFGANGTTNNFISLKTLTQRLQYGRDVLQEFWNHLVVQVQRSMGFRFPAKVEFEYNNLGDETAEKALLLQMADRNLISDELLQRSWKHDPELERIRLNRETREREQNRMVDKAGPYYDPQFDEAVKKSWVQTGAGTPSEVGVELEPRKSGEQPALKLRQPPGGGVTPTKKKGQPQQGRPKNSTDKSQRKTKTFKPKSKAHMILWATTIQDNISKILNPFLLKHFSKSNLRQLTKKQREVLDTISFDVLSHIVPFTDVDERVVYNALQQGTNLNASIYDAGDTHLTADEHKQLRAIAYAEIYDGNDSSDV